MPFFKHADKLFYFAHVPKCGGTSVERALIQSGLSLSFYDGKFLQRGAEAWYKSSPQHVTREAFDCLFADDFFHYKFTVVRDPVSRFLSAYNHNRLRIGRTISIKRLVGRLEKNKAGKNDFFGEAFDNHFVPAVRFMPEGTEVFRLEDGMQNILTTLSERVGTKIASIDVQNKRPYDIHFTNTKLKRLAKEIVFPRSPKLDQIDPELKDRIIALYAEDAQLS